jgi:hypothetical protein
MVFLLLILILDARAGQKGTQSAHPLRRLCRSKVASIRSLTIVLPLSVNFAKGQILQQHQRISATRRWRLLVPFLYSLALDDAKNTVH